jgi:hypothetical protein
MGTVAKSSFAAGRIRKGVDSFKPSNFGREAEDLFAQLNAAFADGDLGALDRLVTEQLFQTLKNQIKQDNKRFKEKKGKAKGKKGKNAPKVQRKAYYVLSYPEPASIMQLRLLQQDPKEPHLAFGQVTVRIRSERVVAEFDERGNAVKPAELIEGAAIPAATGATEGNHLENILDTQESGAGHRAAVAILLGDEEVGEWKEASSEDGTKYYWNTVTKESAWELPGKRAEAEVEAKAEENEAEAKIDGEADAKTGGAVASADSETMDTVSYVVFESALFGPNKMWRVCMIDERGPDDVGEEAKFETMVE